MDLKAEQHYVHLGSGLYLDPKGKLVDNLPANATVSRLPYELNIPDPVKGAIKGLDVAAIPGVLTAVSPVLDELGISKKTVEVIAACVGLAIGLCSVVGTVGAAVNLMKALGIFGAGDDGTLQKIAADVAEIKKMQYASLRQAAVDKVAVIIGQTSGSRSALHSYLRKPALDRTDYEALRTMCRQLTNNLAQLTQSPEYQKLPFSLDQVVGKQQWADWRPWLYSRDPNLPDGSRGDPELKDAARLNSSDNRWDYTLYLGPILETVTLMLAFQRLIDPALRTSGQFEHSLRVAADGLTDLARRMTSVVNWTAPYDPAWHHASHPAYLGWPVGAADICSGVSSFDPFWRDGMAIHPTATDYWGRPVVMNMEDMLRRAGEQREVAWLVVWNAIGVPQVLALAAICRELATVPPTSETVTTKTKTARTRQLAGNATLATPKMLACPSLTFPAELYRTARTVTITGTLQPEAHTTYYKIPYRFFLDSYQSAYGQPVESHGSPTHRYELQVTPGQRVTLDVCTFDWCVRRPDRPGVSTEIRPALTSALRKIRSGKTYLEGTALPPAMPVRTHTSTEFAAGTEFDPSLPLTFTLLEGLEGVASNNRWGKIELDYSFKVVDGGFTVKIASVAGKECNIAGLCLTVEEQPLVPGARPIRTQVDLSTVAVEHHLPREYFDYIEACNTRQRKIIDDINRKRWAVPRGKKPVPSPAYDPRVFSSPRDWFEHVVELMPDRFTRAELAEFRTSLPDRASATGKPSKSPAARTRGTSRTAARPGRRGATRKTGD